MANAPTQTAQTKPTAATAPAKPADKKPKENPADTFRRLANRRVSKTVKAISLVSNLGRYPHTAEQGTKIVAALRAAVDGVEASFSKTKSANTSAFDVDA